MDLQRGEIHCAARRTGATRGCALRSTYSTQSQAAGDSNSRSTNDFASSKNFVRQIDHSAPSGVDILSQQKAAAASVSHHDT
jgi:hypothetical protein